MPYSISSPQPDISLTGAVNTTAAVVGAKTVPSAEYVAWEATTEHNNKVRVIDLQIILGLWLGCLIAYHAVRKIGVFLTHRWGPQENIRGGGHWYVRALRASRAWIRKNVLYVTVPTPFFTYTAPEMLLVFFYFLILYFVLLTDVSRSPLFAPTNGTVLGTGNRSAMIFVATLPWIIALATKNNLISTFTGIPYERLQIYHRACSRISLSLILIHTVIKLKASTSMAKDWRRWGVGAFIFAGALFVTSHRNGMQWCYQVFVHLHVPLVAGLFVSIYLHTVNTPLAHVVQPFLLASATLWAIDMLQRWVQLIYINALYRPRAASVTTSSMTILSPGMLRVEMSKPGLQKWTPGSHVYLFSPPFLGVSPFWQSHPFTIASVSEGSEGQQSTSGSVISEKKKKWGHKSRKYANGSMELQALRQSEVNEEQQPAASPTHNRAFSADTQAEISTAAPGQSKLVFLIKKRKGFTKKLYEAAQLGKSSRLLVYGPLSPPVSYLSGYETLVFFSGGSGVSWTLPLLLDACRNQSKNYRMTRQIFWIWSVTNSEHMHWIESELTQALSTDIAQVTVDIRIHITQETAHIRDAPRAWEEVVPSSSKSNSRQRAPWIIQGRPDVYGLLSSAVESAGGRIWVGVSGPESLQLTVRGAVRDWINPSAVWHGEAKGDLTLHCESFGW